MPFSSLGLHPDIIKAFDRQGYTQPTQIQAELIPTLLSGRDVLAGAQTGTGKTAGFVTPVLHQMMKERVEGSPHYIQALILVPTRELAKQVAQATQAYSQFLDLRSMSIFGGTPMASQTKRLEEGVDILIATPGRLIEHLTQKNLNLQGVRHFILDEADTILDMGFIREVSQIIRELTPKRQNILISATLSSSLKELSHSLLERPLLIEMATMGSTVEQLQQVLYPVEKSKKLELLSYLIGSRNYQQVLVFVRKKVEAQEVTKELLASGLTTATIHGDKSSGARSRALNEFKKKKVRVLVATDIAARGLDIKGLDVVINYDIPHVVQDYIHRIGRTGRAGRKGLAIILSSHEESVALRDVEKMLGKALPREIIEGYAPPKAEALKGARKSNSDKKPKTAGAFGKKNQKSTTTKKRKTTKRDGYRSESTVQTKPKSRKKR